MLKLIPTTSPFHPSIRLWQTGGAHRGAAALGQRARGEGEGPCVVGAKALLAEDAVLPDWGNPRETLGKPMGKWGNPRKTMGKPRESLGKPSAIEKPWKTMERPWENGISNQNIGRIHGTDG